MTDFEWDIKFVGLAEHVSTWSKDPSTKVGAVIVDDQRRIVSIGYNGLPRGINDTDKRLNDRELKYKSIIHAEKNALIFAQRSVKGMTLYTFPLMPCASCASLIIQSGIGRVVSPNNNNPRWLKDFEITIADFKEAGIQLDLIELNKLLFVEVWKRP